MLARAQTLPKISFLLCCLCGVVPIKFGYNNSVAQGVTLYTPYTKI